MVVAVYKKEKKDRNNKVSSLRSGRTENYDLILEFAYAWPGNILGQILQKCGD